MSWVAFFARSVFSVENGKGPLPTELEACLGHLLPLSLSCVFGRPSSTTSSSVVHWSCSAVISLDAAMTGVMEEVGEDPLKHLHKIHSQTCLAWPVQKRVLKKASGRLTFLPVLSHHQSAQTKPQLKLRLFIVDFTHATLCRFTITFPTIGILNLHTEWVHVVINFYLFLAAGSWHCSVKATDTFWTSLTTKECKSKLNKGLKIPSY